MNKLKFECYLIELEAKYLEIGRYECIKMTVLEMGKVPIV